MNNLNEIKLQTSKYIKQFQDFSLKYPGPVAHSVQLDFGKYKEHIVFSAIVHGEEVGSLPAIISTITSLASKKVKFGGRVTFLLGNVPAALENKRFLEQDLNRAFGENSDVQNTYEKTRALELQPVLESCDFLFDIHQTKQPTQFPFYTFGFHEKSHLWARAIGGTEMFITRPSHKSFSVSGLCIDEYVRKKGKPAVTLELSQKGYHESARVLAQRTILRVLKNADKIFMKTTTLKKLSHKNRELEFLVTSYKEPFSHPKKSLKESLTNFTKVTEAECLGFDENKKPILSPSSGYLLFPKYPNRDENGNSLELLSEIFTIVKPSNPFVFLK